MNTSTSSGSGADDMHLDGSAAVATCVTVLLLLASRLMAAVGGSWIVQPVALA